MGNTLKLQSPTKLTRLGHFPPANQVGRLAGPVFYVYVFSLAITFSVARYLSSLFNLSFRCVKSRVLPVPAERLGGGAKNFRPLHIFVFPMLLECYSCREEGGKDSKLMGVRGAGGVGIFHSGSYGVSLARKKWPLI
jgi:hypothetical protein